MDITVKYFGGFMKISGKNQESLDLRDGATVGDLAAELAHRHGPRMAELLMPGRERRALIVRDGVAQEDGAAINDGDTFLILFPAAGG